MARKVGQIIRWPGRTWLVRVYNGREVETKKIRQTCVSTCEQTET